MLDPLLRSKNAERILIYIHARGEGYPREIARFFGTDLKSIQKQFDKLEAGGVLVSRTLGRTRPYIFNPRYPFREELKNLLEKSLLYYPEPERRELVRKSRKPSPPGPAAKRH